MSGNASFSQPLTNVLAGQFVDTARRGVTACFKSAGIESAELDARLLLGHVLSLDLTGLITAANRPLTADESARLDGESPQRLVRAKRQAAGAGQAG